eukprot:2291680-Lingulodinium_polyedra.AAC.1
MAEGWLNDGTASASHHGAHDRVIVVSAAISLPLHGLPGLPATGRQDPKGPRAGTSDWPTMEVPWRSA